MNKRLQQFLTAENINQSQFADNLGVARAGVSHILAGRNKPGYDFLIAIMEKYPDLNMEWLMTGKGKMYKSQQTKLETPPVQEPLFSTFHEFNVDNNVKTEATNFNPIITEIQPKTEDEAQNDTPTASESENPVQMDSDPLNIKISEDINTLVKAIQKPVKQRVVTKVVIFFDDNTFQEII